ENRLAAEYPVQGDDLQHIPLWIGDQLIPAAGRFELDLLGHQAAHALDGPYAIRARTAGRSAEVGRTRHAFAADCRKETAWPFDWSRLLDQLAFARHLTTGDEDAVGAERPLVGNDEQVGNAPGRDRTEIGVEL